MSVSYTHLDVYKRQGLGKAHKRRNIDQSVLLLLYSAKKHCSALRRTVIHQVKLQRVLQWYTVWVADRSVTVRGENYPQHYICVCICVGVQLCKYVVNKDIMLVSLGRAYCKSLRLLCYCTSRQFATPGSHVGAVRVSRNM